MMQPQRWAFYYYGRVLRPHLERDEPLGGTESALLSLARALAARGHAVTIYGNDIVPAQADGVAFAPLTRCEAECTPARVDCFVSVRHMAPCLAGRFGVRQWLWTPDAADQPFHHQAVQVQFTDQQDRAYQVGVYSLKVVAPWIDRVACVGQWQAATLTQRFGLSRDLCWVGYNPVDTAACAAAAQLLAARERRIVYASTPYRGLEHLVRVFPAIRARVPDVRATICSSMQVYGVAAAQDQEQFGAIYRAATALGMEWTGALTKPALYDRLGASRVMAYPNTFAETFCIAAAEAQAAGVPVVTTDAAALRERIVSGASGYLIPGRPDEPAYATAFVEHVVRLLTDDAQWHAQSAASRAAVAPYDATAIAARWEAALAEQLTQPVPPRAPFAVTPVQCNVLVDGYAKRVDLPVTLLRRHIAAAFTAHGFPKAAATL